MKKNRHKKTTLICLEMETGNVVGLDFGLWKVTLPYLASQKVKKSI